MAKSGKKKPAKDKIIESVLSFMITFLASVLSGFVLLLIEHFVFGS